MNRATRRLFLYCSILFSTCLYAEDRCGGGGDGGPKPLSDISDGFKLDTKMIPTDGVIQDFFFWEKSNSLVYRNLDNDVFQAPDHEPTSYTKITSTSRALARITDESERYLASESSPAVFDRKYNRWLNYALDARPFRHLFWHNDKLYSISAKINQDNWQFINVYRYKVGDSSAKKVCKTIQAPPGEHYTLAEGHSHPDIFFYRTKQGGLGKLISVYRMDLDFLCNIAPLAQYTREIAGPVKSVHLFRELKALAVEVDHPTKNLLWDDKHGCRYFNVDRQKPLVLNYKLPLVVTWNQKDGMTLVDMEKETKANLAWAYDSVTELTQRDVWLADDGIRLFLTPGFGYDSTRWLFRMTLSDSP